MRFTAPAEGARLEWVDALRGAAALAVAWFHLTNTYAPGPVQASGAYGYLGVQTFFVISGFIIPYSLHRFGGYVLSDFPHFFARRIIRIEPPYILSVIMVIVLWELSALVPQFRGGDPSYSITQVILHFFYLIPLSSEDWLQPVYWTLAFEFAFYIVIGLLFPFIGQQGQTKPFVALAAVVIGAVLLGFSLQALLFVIGIACYRTAVCGDPWWVAAAVSLSASAGIVAVGYPAVAVTGVLTAVLIMATLASPLPGGLVGRTIGWLGTISYSLYLIHVPIGGRVVNLGGRFIDGELGQLALSLIALSICLVAATVFCWLVEKPAIDAARRVPMRVRATTST